MKNHLRLLVAIATLAVPACQKANAQIYQATQMQTHDAGYAPGIMFDIDKNGYNDYFVYKSSQPAVFLADSNGLATRNAMLADLVTDLPGVNAGASRKPMVTDIDGDGNKDLIFHMMNVGLVRTATFNTSTSKYNIITVIPQTALPLGGFMTAAADFNGDGRTDILLSGVATALCLQQQDGSFTNQSIATGFSVLGQLVAEDMDNDGDIDFLVPGGSPARLKLFRNNGNATFTPQDIANLVIPGRAYGSTNSGMVVADIDSDGDKDIVVGSNSGTWVSIYKNTIGVYSETLLRAPIPNSGSTPITVTDFDEDGDLDIIAGRASVAATGSTGMSLFENYGGGSFTTERSIFHYNSYNYSYNLTIAGMAEDFNSDGKLDYLIAQGATWYVVSTKYSYISHPLWALVMETYLGGAATDVVEVTVTNPFKTRMRTGVIYEGSYGGVTGWGHDTDSMYFFGPLSEINAALHWIEYIGVYLGKQYLDIKYTNVTTGQSFANRVNFELTDPGLQTLPAELIAFAAKQQSSTVVLDWKTASENSTSHFEIERAVTNDNHFRKIGTVNAHGNSSTTLAYSYADNTPVSGVNKYRLRIIDIDGKSDYSKVVTATIKPENKLKVFPVPAENQITIQLEKSVSSIEITDVLGRTIRQVPVLSGTGTVTVIITDLNPGTYYIKSPAGSAKFIRK